MNDNVISSGSSDQAQNKFCHCDALEGMSIRAFQLRFVHRMPGNLIHQIEAPPKFERKKGTIDGL
jgi:hypothetical protein